MRAMATTDGSTTPEPPQQVLVAYGITGPPTPIAGGQGTSYRAGDLVLKPDADAEFIQWWQTSPANSPNTGRSSLTSRDVPR